MDLESLSARLDKICRVCLKICDQDSGSRSVFREHDIQEILEDNLFFVYEIVCEITSDQISKGDGYPTLICSSCMVQAHIAYKFKKLYEQSHQVILQCLHKKSLIETSEAHEDGTIEVVLDDEDDNERDDIFNFSEIENVNIETIFDELHPSEGPVKPIIKNVSMLNKNKIARKCFECKYVFQTAYGFHNHACNREEGKKKLCPTCGKSISKSHYNKHLYMHSGRRDYICQICNKAYNASGSLKFHMAKHTGEKPYLCSLCGKRFIQPTGLKYHMRFHNNERRYKCSFCDKRFVMQSHCVAHERVHTGYRPFICEICAKGFTRKVELKAHAFLHSGERPHRCRVCQKTFVRKTHLRLHEMIHSEKKPHECNLCGKGFTQRLPFQLHMRMHEEVNIKVQPNEDDPDDPDDEDYGIFKDYDNFKIMEIKEFL